MNCMKNTFLSRAEWKRAEFLVNKHYTSHAVDLYNGRRVTMYTGIKTEQQKGKWHWHNIDDVWEATSGVHHVQGQYTLCVTRMSMYTVYVYMHVCEGGN